MSESDIILHAIGVVSNDIDNPLHMPVGGRLARIEIFPEYRPALQGIEENSHIWLLMWFHQSDRQILRVRPLKINPDLPEYGVFALRAFNRPNPIGLTMVKLEKVEETHLWVAGLDAINGTPVLDIKPYYEADIMFSPRTSYIRPNKRQMRQEDFYRHALAHHQEECGDLLMAVRMVLVVDELLGQITNNDIAVTVCGSRCLADTVQGLTHARLASPDRFTFIETISESPRTIWARGETSLTLTGKCLLNQDDFWNLDDKEVLDISR